MTTPTRYLGMQLPCAARLLLVLAAFLLLSTTASAQIQPLCSLPSAARPAAFLSATLSYASTQGSYALWAETAFTTFINNLYSYNDRHLLPQYGNGDPAPYWNSAIGCQALLQYAAFHSQHGIPGLGWGADTVIQQVQYIVSNLQGQYGTHLYDNYNDDMAWMIHALTLLHDTTNQSSYLTLAQSLLTYIQRSDDTTCCGTHPGGVWWDLAHTSKATAAQAGVTVAALRIVETAGTLLNSSAKATLLAYAQSHYAFWTTYFVNRQTGQVADHEDLTGALTWWGFSYNNALVLGAAVHLYNLTHDVTYLNDAALFTSYLLNNGRQVTINGTSATILANDCNGCDGDCSQFHQVGFHYLQEYYNLLLTLNLQSASTPTSTQLDAMCNLYTFLQHNVQSLWLNARDPSTGFFNCNWDAQFTTGTNALQGSMNSAVSAFALFASTPILMATPASSSSSTASSRSSSSAHSSSLSSSATFTSSPSVTSSRFSSSSSPSPSSSSSAAVFSSSIAVASTATGRLCFLLYSLPGGLDYPFSIAYSLTVTYQLPLSSSAAIFTAGSGTRTYTNRFGDTVVTPVTLGTNGPMPTGVYINQSEPLLPLGLYFTLASPVQQPGNNPQAAVSQLTLLAQPVAIYELGSYLLDPLGQAAVSTIPGFRNTSIGASNLNALAADYNQCTAPIAFTNGLRSPTEAVAANSAGQYRFNYTISDGLTYRVSASLLISCSTNFATTLDQLGNPYQIVVNITGTRVYTNLSSGAISSAQVVGLANTSYAQRFYPYSLLAAQPGVYTVNSAPFLDANGLSFMAGISVVTVQVAKPSVGTTSAVQLMEAAFASCPPLSSLQTQGFGLGAQ